MLTWKKLSYADLGRAVESALTDQVDHQGPALVEQGSTIRPEQGEAFHGFVQAIASKRNRFSL